MLGFKFCPDLRRCFSKFSSFPECPELNWHPGGTRYVVDVSGELRLESMIEHRCDDLRAGFGGCNDLAIFSKLKR